MADALGDMAEREEAAVAAAPQVEVRRLRPPDRKQMEEDTEAINVLIREKEADMKALNLRSDESVAGDLRSIRSEKDVTIGRRKRIDNELREVNQQISKQMENLTKIQSSLAYKNEDRINEAIRRLDHQLKTNNFTLREEKKIVAEIDRMKRSKKALVQYNALKSEIDGLRGRQRMMREERDRLFKLVTALKTREEDLKRKTASNRAKADEIKSELDVLYERRRGLVSEFKRAEQEFNDVRKENRRQYRDEMNRKREEERRQQLEQYQKDLAEYEASREPYEDEKQLCTTLTTYLQRHLATVEPNTVATGSDTPPDGQSPRSTTTGEASASSSSQDSSSTREPKDGGMYVLRKKEEDQCLFGGIARAKPNKRSKRDKRKSFNKPMVHTPEIFAQFASLNLTAPSSTTEVAASIDQLHEKRRYYESLPPPARPSIQIDSGTEAPSDGSAPSYTESALTESIPSTPETLALDGNPPRFPRVGEVTEDSAAQWPLPRKLSHDSGLCELDGGEECHHPQTPVAPSSSSSMGGGQKHHHHQHHQGATGVLHHPAAVPVVVAPASIGGDVGPSLGPVLSDTLSAMTPMTSSTLPLSTATTAVTSLGMTVHSGDLAVVDGGGATTPERQCSIGAPPVGELTSTANEHHSRLLNHLSLS